MLAPRKERLSWHSHHMLVALIASMRSPDPSTCVGACCVGLDNRIKSTGYNGLVRGISAERIDWSRKADNPLDTKYPYVVHAEENAILNATSSLKDCSIFITMYSCSGCAKIIIQSGISRVYYLTNPYRDTWECEAARRMFDMADIQVREFKFPPEEAHIIDTIKNVWLEQNLK